MTKISEGFTHETQFTLCDFEGNEYSFEVTANFIPGEPAARDDYGRKTECDTADDWELLTIVIDGKEREINDAFASLFEKYCYRKKGFVMMTAADLEDKIKEELQYSYEFFEEYGDELPF